MKAATIETMHEDILSPKEVETALAELHVEWAAIPVQGLVRVFATNDFMRGLTLVNTISKVAEQLNHHPEITLRQDQVEVATLTQELGGLTERDIELARAIDQATI